MDEDTLMGRVQSRAELGSRAESERSVRAILETLAERIPAGLAGNVAAQLPHEVGEALRRIAGDPSHADGEGFNSGEFLRRVGERAGVDEPQAARLAQVVFGVVDEAAVGVMDNIRNALPQDMQQLAERPNPET